MTRRSICLKLLPSLLVLGCDDPVRPEDRELLIRGYTISGQAHGVDPVTSEDLDCVFLINLDTGGPLIGSWTDTTTIIVKRIRTSPSQVVTHDTIVAGQEVTLTVPDSSHIQISVSGPFSESLNADMLPAYPGYGSGSWSCGPSHPLSRVQPDAVLTGQWQSHPIIDIPIE